MLKFIDTESKMVVSRDCEAGEMERCSLRGREFQFFKTKSYGNWLHNNMTVIKTTKLHTRRRRWHPLQYSCLESPMDGGAWWLQSMGSLRVRHD